MKFIVLIKIISKNDIVVYFYKNNKISFERNIQ